MSKPPVGWSASTVGTIFQVVGGGTPDTRQDEYWGGDIPWITSADLEPDGKISPRKLVTLAAVANSACNIVPGDSVIVATRIGLGKVGHALQRMAFSQDCQALLPTPAVIPQFAANQLRWTARGFRARSRGTTISGITKKQLLDSVFFVPPLAEQERILAAIEEEFSRIDAGLTALERVRKRIDGLIRKALDAAVGQGEPEADGWAWSTIGASAVRMDYGTSTKTSEALGIPVLRMGNIQSGRISLASLKFLPKNHPEVERFILEPGDILFNRTNSPELVGKTAVYEGDPSRALFASYLVRVRCGAGALPHWVAAAINCSRGRQYIASVRTQQVGQANVSASKLARMPIQIPDREIQRRRLAALDELNWSTAQLLSVRDALMTKADALRSTILAAAFSGRLVPQDPNDEPASNLLARIVTQRAASNGNSNPSGASRRRTKVTA
jgi:type I restriction enzyme S subunit